MPLISCRKPLIPSAAPRAAPVVVDGSGVDVLVAAGADSMGALEVLTGSGAGAELVLVGDG